MVSSPTLNCFVLQMDMLPRYFQHHTLTHTHTYTHMHTHMHTHTHTHKHTHRHTNTLTQTNDNCYLHY